MLLTGSFTELVTFFIQILSREFSMKDLGLVHHFLGVEISTTANGLHLSQSHYALTILDRSSMLHCKPMSTPLKVKFKINADTTSIADPSFVGLLVLSNTSHLWTRSILQCQLCFTIHAQSYNYPFETSLVHHSIPQRNNCYWFMPLFQYNS
jgi:hypothetical protein